MNSHRKHTDRKLENKIPECPFFLIEKPKEKNELKEKKRNQYRLGQFLI